MSFLRRQIVSAAFTANALRPAPGIRVGIPSFFAGWLTTELAPQLLALIAADTAAHVTPRRRSAPGLLLAAANAAGLAHLVRQGLRVKGGVETALVEGIGVDYVEQLDAPPTPAELATPWRQMVNPFWMRDVRVRVERDIAYSEFGRRSMLDIYLPAETPADNAPVLLQVHGGGWSIGNKERQGIQLMQHMAAKGWICVAINYRLSPRSDWPAHIVDVKSAIAWTKEHIGAYGGNPDYIAITGGSAGGHLTALAALTAGDPEFQPGFEEADTSVQAAIPHYGVYDFAGATGLASAEQMRDVFLSPRVLKRTWLESPDIFEKASPILRVTADAPDFFVVHGANDTLVPVEQARLFVAELRRTSSATVVYAELPGAQHAFDIFPSIRSAHMVRAIDRYLHWHWSGWRHGRSITEEAEAVIHPDPS